MRSLLAVAALAAAFFASPTAKAQSAFMPYVGYNLEYEQFLIGAGARFGLPVASPVRFALQPSVEVSLDEDTYVQLDGNVIVEFNGRTVAPYAGLGIGVLIPDGDTEAGLNVVGGLVFRSAGFVKPFVQGRYTTAYDGAFTVQAGAVLGF